MFGLAGGIAKMRRQLERLEVRMKLLEDEQREGSFDLSRFYKPDRPPQE